MDKEKQREMKEDTIEYTIRMLWQDSERDLQSVIDDFHFVMKQIDKNQITWSEWCRYDQEEMKSRLTKEKQRELIKEIIQADEKDGLYDWDVTLNDGLNEEETFNTKEK